ncbi:hypothetical protein CALCODRAFT_499005 [Calocera cornea HHB12733]|uniref:Uncharacterized protein n=1 Tax=Calocera cornea HHB12733 TaxID=1353952 RepID=A0A165EKN0_9BASI|nr:hypothetical protein CALCODRAFT_499005 [Calocera cornea HHB12733]
MAPVYHLRDMGALRDRQSSPLLFRPRSFVFVAMHRYSRHPCPMTRRDPTGGCLSDRQRRSPVLLLCGIEPRNEGADLFVLEQHNGHQIIFPF